MKCVVKNSGMVGRGAVCGTNESGRVCREFGVR